jgi:hypothetical protein
MSDLSPLVNRPSPEGIKIIEEHLRKHKLRLIDLFVFVDRGKRWQITRDDFRVAIKKVRTFPSFLSFSPYFSSFFLFSFLLSFSRQELQSGCKRCSIISMNVVSRNNSYQLWN